MEKRSIAYCRICLGMIALLLALIVLAAGTGVAQAGEGAVVRMVYFTSAECPHCRVVRDEVLSPLEKSYGSRLEIKLVDISDPNEPGGINPITYEMLIRAEEMFGVSPEEQGLPMAIVGERVLVGEIVIREQLPGLVDAYLEMGGTSWPDVPGLAEFTAGVGDSVSDVGSDPGDKEGHDCGADEEVCEVASPVWMAYFYEVGCQECSRAEYDIRYVESRYPQLIVEEYNAQTDVALIEWLGARFGVPETQRLATPVMFVGDDYLIGAEITCEAVTALAEKYAAAGTERKWSDFDRERAEQSIVARFESFGVLTVAFAGLVDGLNPCAFATLAFFVSYLALSGRQGKEVLIVGGAFTLGVFLAYLAVGLGFYKVLDLLKARRGDIGDMALNLPHRLRMRINAVIRKGRRSRAFVAGSFITGIAVSFLELACTGQVYLPTIIFVVSQPQLQARAVVFLILYNVLFIMPLMVVFVLAYYGTGSKQLTRFLEEKAAVVKLGLTVLFAALASWLLVSVVVG
jgi:cytochrome c biogenesis protein CcdA